MANRRELIIEEFSSLPLPPPSLVNGEDAASYDQLAAAEVRRAAALDAIDNRRVAERLRAAARDAERAAMPPVDGEFALVPEPDAATRSEPA